MKKSISLFITIVFIILLTAILSQILKNSNKYIDESSHNVFLVQLNYVIENFKKETIKNIRDDNIDDFVNIASNGIPLYYGNNNLILKASKTSVSLCDVNSYSSTICPDDQNNSTKQEQCQSAKDSCDAIFNNLADGILFVNIIKRNITLLSEVSNFKQWRYLQNIYYEDTGDKLIFEKLDRSKIFFLKLKKPNTTNTLKTKISGTIFAKDIQIDILYDINGTSSEVLNIETTF
jgi:hypothetical protein